MLKTKQPLLLLLGAFTLLSSSIIFAAKTTPPTVTSPTTGTITTTTAVLGGTVTDIGTDAIVEVGVEWGTVLATYTGTQTVAYPGLNTPFTVSVTGLSVNTTYYWRAYATNAGTGNTTGTTAEGTFTTLSGALTAPTVTAQAATAVGTDVATLHGNVTVNG